MSDLTDKYAIPPELAAFIDAGFVEFLSENDAEKTATFLIPSIGFTDEQGRDTYFTLIWIHPDFNEQFCHYYNETPGDLENFYVYKETDDAGNEWLDIETLDDLIAWLDEKQEMVNRR